MKGLFVIFWALISVTMAAQYTEHCNKIKSSFPKEYTMTGGITGLEYDATNNGSMINIRFSQAGIKESAMEEGDGKRRFMEISSNLANNSNVRQKYMWYSTFGDDNWMYLKSIDGGLRNAEYYCKGNSRDGAIPLYSDLEKMLNKNTGHPKTVMSLIGFPDGFTCNETHLENMANGVSGLFFLNDVVGMRGFVEILFKLPTDDQLKDPLYYPQPLQSSIFHADPPTEGGSSPVIQITLTPHYFVNLVGDVSEFYPDPNDVTCTNKLFGELTDVPVPPEEMTLTVESIFFALTESLTWKKLVVPSEEWYTPTWNLSMSRYRWKDIHHFTDDQVSIREVRDFEAGIFYRIYEEYNNCSVHPLTDIDLFDLHDVRIDESGHPKIARWYHLFGYDKLLTVNSMEWDSRGFTINYYQNVSNGHSTILGITPYLSVDSDGTQFWGYPTSVEFYNTKLYNEIETIWRQNIFNYDPKPAINLRQYDIRGCFDDPRRMEHREIRFPLSKDIGVLKDLYIFEDAMQVMLSFWGQVQFLRIQQVEASYDEIKNMVYFVFSVLDFPREQLNATLIETLDQKVIVPMPTVLMNIEEALKSGQALFEFETFDGVQFQSTADSTYFKMVDRGKDDPGTDQVVNKKIFVGHTGAATGGLAFGMILLGLILGCAVYYFKMRNGIRLPLLNSFGMKRTETPRMAFENPLD